MLLRWFCIFAAVFTFSPVHSVIITGDTVQCDKGWYQFRYKCLIIRGKSRSERNYWEDALKQCKEDGGTLVSIHAKEELDFIITFLLMEIHAPVWIGLRRRNNSEFTWEDGSPVDYTNWMENEPSSDANQDCGVMLFQPVVGTTGRWDNIKCGEWRAFICQKRISRRKKSPNPQLCPATEGGGMKFHQSCYNVVMEMKSWEDAERHCRDNYNGHLATILEQSVDLYLDYVLSDIKRDLWIGMKITDEILPKWVSGWFISYNRTDTDHAQFPEETCVLRKSSQLWPMEPCSKMHPFICETTKVLPPVLEPHPKGSHCPEIPNDWIDLGGEYCYFFETNNLYTWQEANFECNRRGGQLLSIHSQEESDIIQPFLLFIPEGKYIGLIRQTTRENAWIWSDGSKMDYENWSYMEPSHSGEKCGEIWPDFDMEWNDVVCNSATKRGFLCAIKKVTPNATVEEDIEYECSSKCYIKKVLKSVIYN